MAFIVPPSSIESRSDKRLASGPRTFLPPISSRTMLARTYSRSPMIAADAFRADGGSACLDAARKMYEAASLAVRLAKTGPERRASELTACSPRFALGSERGVNPLAATVLAVLGPREGSTRAYQYHIPTMARIMMRQPSLRRHPNMSQIRARVGWLAVCRNIRVCRTES